MGYNLQHFHGDWQLGSRYKEWTPGVGGYTICHTKYVGN